MSQYEEWLERELDLLEAHCDGEFNRDEAREWLEGTTLAHAKRISQASQGLMEQLWIYQVMLKLARYLDRKMRA